MAVKTKHIQCRVQRGETQQVCFLPERFAIEGKLIDLLNPKGVWEEGWTVLATGVPLDSEFIRDVVSQQHKNMKGMTDI